MTSSVMGNLGDSLSSRQGSGQTSQVSTPAGKTDVIYQQFKLFIEGVQVPFETINISQGIGSLPTATISIPAQAGLMDIARFYQPKVHVFYTDRVGYYSEAELATPKKLDKLLFTGHINRVSYSKTRNGSGGVSIQFGCVHKNYLINECLVDYSGWLKEDTDQNRGSIKPGHQNSKAAVLEALSGIAGGINPSAEVSSNTQEAAWDVSVLPQSLATYYPKLQGLTGLLVNFWNQLKRSGYSKFTKDDHDGFIKLYMPLIENGLQFFQRLSGHPLIESKVENTNSRQEPCPDTPGKFKKVMIPPCNRVFMKSAAQTNLTISLMSSYLETSHELTSMMDIFSRFFESIEYELLTLASPAKAPVAAFQPPSNSTDKAIVYPETSIVETIVKPRIPFYYSPICNVLLPQMYHTIQVDYDEASVPTRIDAANLESPGSDAFPTHIRAPHSVRTAIAARRIKLRPDVTYNLAASMSSSYGAIGLYEQGRGVRSESIVLPRWLALLSSSSYAGADGGTDVAPDLNSDPESYQALQDLLTGWKKRYPALSDVSMCPWSTDAGISTHQKILFAAVDYYHTQAVARSKGGYVTCPFNPFIVPGYPMDIIDSSPTMPSFHAMCVSVSHSITASSVATSVSFAAAMTYSELANYYFPMIHPYLQTVLGLAVDPSIVMNESGALTKATDFYKYTLGVCAVAPDHVYDFSTGLPKPIDIAGGVVVPGSGESLPSSNGGELNPNLSYEGNLSLVYREIENREDVETAFGIKFVDMVIDNYSPTVIKYTDDVLVDSDKLELGANQFLTYDTMFGVLINNTMIDNSPTITNANKPSPNFSTTLGVPTSGQQFAGLPSITGVPSFPDVLSIPNITGIPEFKLP